MNKLLISLAAKLLAALRSVCHSALYLFAFGIVTAWPAVAQDPRPNILLVVVDDAGFMDFGAYGSDTATPNIDRLAQSGAMFTRFYTSPQCGPSRAMLLTGQDNHVIGMGSIAEVMNEPMRALPAYQLKWKEEQKTIASRLQAAGYQTLATGKWGIGHIGENLPHRFGFDRSWVLDSTGANNHSTQSYLPVYDEMKWFEDGKQVALPDEFYSSRNIVDKMIQYVDERDSKKPFFGYLSFQAIHVPLQVSKDYIDKYNGVFDRGWDVMQRERLKKAVALGLVPASTQLPHDTYNRRKWADLSDSEKAYWARVMQANAGMMEAADFHLGRLLNHLSAQGLLDNTIVVVVSDNGPEGATLGKTSALPTLIVEKLWMNHVGWDVEYDNIGQRSSIAAIGHEWATVSAAPFNLFKFNAGEGGMRVPMVVAGPGISPSGIQHARAQIADITPTLLEAAGVNFASDEFNGRSLIPVLTKQADQVYGDQDSMAFEVSGTAALYRGQWKITNIPAPYGNGEWQLFDLSVDPSETKDLSTVHPELFRDMRAEYKRYAETAGIYEFAPGDSARKQLIINNIERLFYKHLDVVIGAGVAALALVLAVIWAIRVAIKRGRSGMPKKSILITGAATGIGRDAAKCLLDRGHHVYATVHHPDEIAPLQLALGPTASVFKLDITIPEDRLQIAALPIDVLINNAAQSLSGSLAEVNIDRVRRLFEINLFSSLELTQVAIRGMVARGRGTVIFMSSITGRVPEPFVMPYSMTKFAISAAAAGLREEMKALGKGIQVCVVEPGPYNTGFNQKLVNSQFEHMEKEGSMFSREQIQSRKKMHDAKLRWLEVGSTDTIVSKIVSAAEARKPRLRYVAPWTFALLVRLLRISGV